MLNETYFELENPPRRYGPSAIQPSVGDAGAPVFRFIGNVDTCVTFLLISFLAVSISGYAKFH